jgi:hypothetical protein
MQPNNSYSLLKPHSDCLLIARVAKTRPVEHACCDEGSAALSNNACHICGRKPTTPTIGTTPTKVNKLIKSTKPTKPTMHLFLSFRGQHDNNDNDDNIDNAGELFLNADR